MKNQITKILSYIDTDLKYRMVKGSSLELIEQGLCDHPEDNISLEYKKDVIKRILKSYTCAKRDQINVPETYFPGHKWAPQITEKRREYIEALENNDVDRLGRLLGNFFRNSGVLSIIKYSLFPQLMQKSKIRATYAKKQVTYNVLLDIETWKKVREQIDLKELAFPNIGNPYGCVIDGVLINPSACSLNYYASKIDKLLAETQSPVVAEIGGGFGGLAFYLLKMQYSRYINFDLPEVLVIAQYFLMMAFPQKRFLLYGEGYPDLSLLTMADYDVILLPNFELPKLAASSVDVFVNTHSLSEMDNPTVKEYLTQIERVTKKFFYHENSETRRDIGYGSLEVPADTFISSLGNFQLIYRQKAIWREERYWEYLFEKIKG